MELSTPGRGVCEAIALTKGHSGAAYVPIKRTRHTFFEEANTGNVRNVNRSMYQNAS